MDAHHQFMKTLSSDVISKIHSILVRGSFGGAIVAVLVIVTAFITEVILARILGSEDYGRFTYALAIVNILATVARVGMDGVVGRFIPSYAVTEEWGRLRGLSRYALLTAAILGLILMLVMMAIVFWGSAQRDPALQSVLLLASMLVPIMACGTIFQSHLRAFKRIVIAQLPMNVFAPTALVVTAASLTVSGVLKVGALGAVTIQILVTGTACVVLWWIYRMVRPGIILRSTPDYRVREWQRIGIVMFFFGSMQIVISQSDTIMLGLFASTTAAGMYNAALKIALLTSAPIFIVNMIAVPMISEMYVTGRLNELRYMFRVIARATAVLTLLAALVIGVLGKYVLWAFGPDFVVAYPALLVLVGGYIINSFSGASGALLLQTGNHVAAAWIMAICAVVNVLLNYLFIPILGMLGAAIASAITLSAWNIAMVLYARKKLGVDPSIFAALSRA